MHFKPCCNKCMISTEQVLYFFLNTFPAAFILTVSNGSPYSLWRRVSRLSDCAPPPLPLRLLVPVQASGRAHITRWMEPLRCLTSIHSAHPRLSSSATMSTTAAASRCSSSKHDRRSATPSTRLLHVQTECLTRGKRLRYVYFLISL